ncbi:ribosomal RNA small subunit methyltransferase A [Patescibacteria group bacterium]|nr:ribosomal RNA small subunit methyltransferase A [Patescibacteria group bacterium]
MTRLGQHFLLSKSVASRMVAAAEITKNDTVLEIGPGKGMLTQELLKKAKKVIAVEKDPKLCTFLKEKFGHLNNFFLIQADIRDLFPDPEGNPREPLGLPSGFKVVANIPYYLTGRLLRQLLETPLGNGVSKWERVVLMIQKEVAKRIITKKKMNLLSISVQVFSKPKIAFYVSRKNFRPQPNVDSAVIVLEKRSKDLFKEHKISQKDFFKLIKTGFRHKRKFLKNNLSPLGRGTSKWLGECDISLNARAEDLSLENWACLTSLLFSLTNRGHHLQGQDSRK